MEARASLYSLVLLLTPVRPVSVGATVGHQVHAAFLHAVRAVAPDLAEALHAQGRARPFTVSPLQGVPRARDGRVLLSPEHTYWLRLSLLDAALYAHFMEYFLDPARRPLLRVGRGELLVREILSTPGAHPWSGHTTWAVLAQVEPADRLGLHFVTPTAFSLGTRSWGKQTLPLPVPELVFSSLARTWNLWAPPELHVDRSAVERFACEGVVVAGMRNGQTRMLQFKHAPQTGFVGQVFYDIKEQDGEMARVLNGLAEFAFYAGVGMKTAMGMGMVRPLRRQREGGASK